MISWTMLCGGQSARLRKKPTIDIDRVRRRCRPQMTVQLSRVEIQLYSITIFFLTHLHNIESRAGRTGRQVLDNSL